MWYLVVSWFMQGIIGWRWLCILIMLTSPFKNKEQIMQAAP